MTGNINMQQNQIINLPDTPSQDHSAVSKKYVKDNFYNTSGDTMTGNLNMGGYEITNIAKVPTTDNSAVTKKWVTDEFPTKLEIFNGFTLSGPIDMNSYEIYGLPDTPNTDDSVGAASAASASGITQAHADGRYVRKTKIALGEWMDTFNDVNFVDYNWSKHVRKSILNVNSNIEIKVASFVTDMNISQLLKHKLL